MLRFHLLAFLLILFFESGSAQTTRYIVRFVDKANNPYSINNPGQFLTARSIDRRSRYHIPLDSTDLPITPRYLDSIRNAGNLEILNTSKWLNQVAIRTDDTTALNKINSFPFIINAAPLAYRERTYRNKFPETTELFYQQTAQRTEGYYEYGVSGGQVNIHHGSFLHNHNFRGEGMQLAVFDAGFYNYQTLPTFDSTRLNNKILSTWDFVDNEENVNEDNSHGMQCLSSIAANLPGVFVGSAPNTSFYLYRTEDVRTEYPIEEQNWAAAAEKADSLGVDIISCSLGYTTFSDPSFDYTYSDLNGHTTISAKAANAAVKKGILVFISAGNEGDKNWHYICTPGDADSAITVGAVDTLGNVAGFSSYGPSSDGNIKPNLASVGWNAIVANSSNGLPVISSGTSFACPNLAGIATCLWQAFPEFSNSIIKDVLQSSADSSSTPNFRTGYGIPDAKKAFVICMKKLYKDVAPFAVDCTVRLGFSLKADSSMKIVIERKLPVENNFTEIHSTFGPHLFSMADYQYTDNLADQPASIIKYRVRIDIGSDTSFYMDTMQFELIRTCIVTENSVNIFQPYPYLNNVYVKYLTASTGKAAILIHNETGQLVYHSEFTHASGIKTYSLPINNLSRGVYFISTYFINKRLSSSKILRQ